jgi:hypothetical protein
MRFIVRTGRGKMLIAAAAVFVYTSSLRLLPFRVPAEKHPQGRETPHLLPRRDVMHEASLQPSTDSSLHSSPDRVLNLLPLHDKHNNPS